MQLFARGRGFLRQLGYGGETKSADGDNDERVQTDYQSVLYTVDDSHTSLPGRMFLQAQLMIQPSR